MTWTAIIPLTHLSTFVPRRRERNRAHARKTRERKKIKLDGLEKKLELMKAQVREEKCEHLVSNIADVACD